MSLSVTENYDTDEVTIVVDDFINTVISLIDFAKLTALHIDEQIPMTELMKNYQEQKDNQ